MDWRSKRWFQSDLLADVPSYRAYLEPGILVIELKRRIMADMNDMNVQTSLTFVGPAAVTPMLLKAWAIVDLSGLCSRCCYQSHVLAYRKQWCYLYGH
jgi:hypothetical protein